MRVLVECLRAEGRKKDALKEAERLFKLSPQSPEIAFLAGRLAEECLEKGKAREYYRNAISLHPSWWIQWRARASLALLELDSGNRKEGLSQLEAIAGMGNNILAASADKLWGFQAILSFGVSRPLLSGPPTWPPHDSLMSCLRKVRTASSFADSLTRATNWNGACS